MWQADRGGKRAEVLKGKRSRCERHTSVHKAHTMIQNGEVKALPVGMCGVDVERVRNGLELHHHLMGSLVGALGLLA